MAANMPGLKGMLPPEIANRMPMPELPGFLASRPPGPGMGDMKMQPPLEMMQTDQMPNGMNGTILDPEKEEKQKSIRLFQAGKNPSSIYSWFLKPLSVLHSRFPTKTTV